MVRGRGFEPLTLPCQGSALPLSSRTDCSVSLAAAIAFFKILDELSMRLLIEHTVRRELNGNLNCGHTSWSEAPLPKR
jgi:hypothetical protein